MVYTGYCGTNKIERGLTACTVDFPLAKARGLSPHVPTRNVSNQDLMCIWRGNQTGRRKHSLSWWSGNEHLSWRVTVLRVGVSPLAIKGSKNWCNNVICLSSMPAPQYKVQFVCIIVFKIITLRLLDIFHGTWRAKRDPSSQVPIKDYSISPVITYNVEITAFRCCCINTKPIDVELTLFDVGVTWRILT